MFADTVFCWSNDKRVCMREVQEFVSLTVEIRLLPIIAMFVAAQYMLLLIDIILALFNVWLRLDMCMIYCVMILYGSLYLTLKVDSMLQRTLC